MLPGTERGQEIPIAEPIADEAGLPRKTILSWVNTVLQDCEQVADEAQKTSPGRTSRGPRRRTKGIGIKQTPEKHFAEENLVHQVSEVGQVSVDHAESASSIEEDASATTDSSFSEESISDQDDAVHAAAFSLHSDARDLICACANAFVKYIATEANKARNDDQRRTITPKHILTALERLGLEMYVPALESLVERVEGEQVERQRKKTGRARFEHTGLSMEELKRQQAELLAAAREQTLWP
jgi:hypothetical protein